MSKARPQLQNLEGTIMTNPTDKPKLPDELLAVLKEIKIAQLSAETLKVVSTLCEQNTVLMLDVLLHAAATASLIARYDSVSDSELLSTISKRLEIIFNHQKVRVAQFQADRLKKTGGNLHA